MSEPREHGTFLGIPIRVVYVIALVAVAVAFVGFLTGTRGSGPPEVWGAAAEPRGARAASDVPFAPTNAELGGEGWRWTGERQRVALAAMLADRPGATATVAPATDEERAQALAVRASRRAYDGAPPRIPHTVPQLGALPCAQCHREGLRVGPHVAGAMSHGDFQSCLGCHVVENAPMPGAENSLASGPPIDNGFVGLEAPTHGPRALGNSPPVIPHPTRMRERCASCHGSLAAGLRSTHPWRQSCTQCHASSADFDQQPRSALGPAAGETPTPAVPRSAP
jgi:cytochrome c-type protein NapB